MKVQIIALSLNNQAQLSSLQVEVEPNDLVIKVKTQIYQLLNRNIIAHDNNKKDHILAKKLTQQFTRQATNTREAANSHQIVPCDVNSDEEPFDYGDNPKFTAKASIIGSSPKSLQLFYKLKPLDNNKKLEDYDVDESSVLYLQLEKKREKVIYLNARFIYLFDNRVRSKIRQKRIDTLRIHCQKEWLLLRR